jgi:hypothetical protein
LESWKDKTPETKKARIIKKKKIQKKGKLKKKGHQANTGAIKKPSAVTLSSASSLFQIFPLSIYLRGISQPAVTLLICFC